MKQLEILRHIDDLAFKLHEDFMGEITSIALKADTFDIFIRALSHQVNYTPKNLNTMSSVKYCTPVGVITVIKDTWS